MKKFLAFFMTVLMVLMVTVPALADDPYQVMGDEYSVWLEATIPAGEEVDCVGRVSGMIMEVWAPDAYVVYNDEVYLPDEDDMLIVAFEGDPMDTFTMVEFKVGNTSEEELSIYAIFNYELGSVNNPEYPDFSETQIVYLEEQSQGYYYSFVPYEDGTLTVSIHDEACTAPWMYFVNVGYSYGDYCFSDSDPIVTTQTFEVTEEEEVLIFVNTYNPEDMWENPEGELVLDIMWVSGSGTEESPYQLLRVDNTITVPAGETVYYTGQFGDMIMTLLGEDVTVAHNGENVSAENGEITMEITAGSMWEPPVIAVTNNSEEDATYEMNFAYPEGTMMNPAEMVEGENTATLEEGNWEGYSFIWTAPYSGVLEIAMTGDNWFYYVDNQTKEIYGDWHYSDDEEIVATETIEVEMGDEIFVSVNTYDPNSWINPAGDITFTATFNVDLGAETNPIVITVPGELSNIDVDAESYVCYALNGMMNGMVLNILGDDYTLVVVNDEVIEPVDGVFSVVLDGVPVNQVYVLNFGPEAASYVASVEYALGSEANPIQINNANDLTSMDVAAGSEVFYAISGMLNGMTLEIKGATAVFVNDVELQAIDGVFSVVLDGTPVNKVLVANGAEEDASYEVSLGYKIVETADNSAVMLYAVMTVVAGAAVVVLVNKKRCF